MKLILWFRKGSSISKSGRPMTMEIAHSSATILYAKCDHENTQYREINMCKLYQCHEISVVS